MLAEGGQMKIRLGTRGSALALVQSRTTASQLEALGFEVELCIIKTQGDLNQRDSLSEIGGKGVFVKEIEQALLQKGIDMAVHSLKDLPSQCPGGLSLADPPRRADCRDALVGPTPIDLLPAGARVGTGSARRQSQLKLLRPDLEFADIRGNVPTRVEKWRSGQFSGGVVLACAGLERLGPGQSGVAEHELHPLSVEQCLPSPCQGILGLQYRSEDLAVGEALAALRHSETALCCRAERAFLESLGGDCNLPAAGLAEVTASGLLFRGRLWWQSEMRSCQLEGDHPESLGRQAAAQLRPS